MTEQQIVIDITISKNEYIKLNWELLTKRKIFWSMLALSTVALILMSLWAESLWPIPVGLILYFLLFYIIIVFTARAAQNRNFYLKRHYTFDESGMSVETSNAQSTAKWDAFTSWKRTKTAYLLFVSQSQMFVIPVHSIPETDRNLFDNWVKTKIISKHKK